MRSIPPLTLAASLLLAAPAPAQVAVARPAATPVAPSAVLADIQRTYDQLEKNQEMEYAKLTQEAKKSKEALEGQIKRLVEQIAHLKQSLKEIESVKKKIPDLLPKVMGPLGSHPSTGPSRLPAGGAADRFAALLAAEIARVGISLSREQLLDLASAIQNGGQAGVAVAMYIFLAIAELSVDRAQSESRPTVSLPSHAAAVAPARRNPNVPVGSAASAALRSLLAELDFLKLTPGEIAVGASMSGAAASSYFAALLANRADDGIAWAEQSIKKSRSAIDDVQQEIKKLEKQLLELQKKRDSAIAALRAQRATALARVPTPTPTPARTLKRP